MSASELMDTFWPEGVSNDPENALQQMLYKVRSLLKKMFPGIENPIISRSRQFRWNPNLNVYLDLEQFEELFNSSRKDASKKADSLMEAIDMYENGVQTTGEQDWLEAIHIYYHTIYLDICRSVMEPLQLDSQWIKIIEICDKVCELEPCADEFIVHMMQALIMLGNQQLAISRYYSFRDKLQQEYDIEPSAEVEQMYTVALNSSFKNVDGQNLLELLGLKDVSGAFFCTFNVFSHLVALERRHTARTNQPSTIIVFSVDGLQLSASTDIHRLESVLRNGLRGYDAVTRLNANSFLVLLADAEVKTADMVAERIKKKFCSEFSQTTAELTYKTVLLPPL